MRRTLLTSLRTALRPVLGTARLSRALSALRTTRTRLPFTRLRPHRLRLPSNLPLSSLLHLRLSRLLHLRLSSLLRLSRLLLTCLCLRLRLLTRPRLPRLLAAVLRSRRGSRMLPTHPLPTGLLRTRLL
ncbi:MAG TPA: hypothetical protein VGL05_16800 [Kribbella sp.]